MLKGEFITMPCNNSAPFHQALSEHWKFKSVEFTTPLLHNKTLLTLSFAMKVPQQHFTE